MVETINQALSATNYDEKIDRMNEVFTVLQRTECDTKVYKPILEKIKKEKISLKQIPALAGKENKKFRGKIAEKIRNLT